MQTVDVLGVRLVRPKRGEAPQRGQLRVRVFRMTDADGMYACWEQTQDAYEILDEDSDLTQDVPRFEAIEYDATLATATAQAQRRGAFLLEVCVDTGVPWFSSFSLLFSSGVFSPSARRMCRVRPVRRRGDPEAASLHPTLAASSVPRTGKTNG
jgi:hypothetical protein